VPGAKKEKVLKQRGEASITACKMSIKGQARWRERRENATPKGFVMSHKDWNKGAKASPNHSDHCGGPR